MNHQILKGGYFDMRIKETMTYGSDQLFLN
jgi:hypothetical protein